MADVTTPIPAGTAAGALIDGKLFGRNLLNDTAGADAMGLVADAPAANTLLGRLKAIAAGLAGLATEATLAALSAKLPASLGAKAQSGSLSIVPATGVDLATNAGVATALAPAKAASATATQVPASTSAGTLLAANANRIGAASVYYDGAGILYLLEGAGTPSATNFTIKLGAGLLTYYETQASFTGAIRGVWSTAAGAANVTERAA